jgi:two-component system response regulator WspF
MRIGIVNDSLIARVALQRAIASVPAHTVAWLARDGAEAVEKALEDRPDLILMDLIMPEVDGVEATRRIMAGSPCPIVVVTSSVSAHMGRV